MPSIDELIAEQSQGAAAQVIDVEDTKRRMRAGVKTLYDAVSSTYGPKGKFVAISRGLGVAPHLTKDGVTVARAVVLDGVEGVAAEMVRQGAHRTAEVAGDGTTTTVVLAYHLLAAMDQFLGEKNLEQWELEQAGRRVQRVLQKCRMDIHNDLEENLYRVALIASNGDDLVSRELQRAFMTVGKDGAVVVEEDRTKPGVTFELSNGFRMASGYASSYLMNDPQRQRIVYEKPLILACAFTIRSIHDILSAVQAAAESRRPLVVIAEDFSEETLAAFVMNKNNAGLQIAAVRWPGTGRNLSATQTDVSVLVDATLFGTNLQTNGKFDGTNFGECNRIVIEHGTTTIVGIEETDRLRQHREKLQAVTLDATLDAHTIAHAFQRLQQIQAQTAVIKIGAATNAALTELKDRVDDAICSMRSAMRSGVLPGGAKSLVDVAAEFGRGKNSMGFDRVVFEAVNNTVTTLLQSVASSTIEMQDILQKLREVDGVAFDFRERDESPPYEYSFGEAMEIGVIDSYEAVNEAFANALQVAYNIYNTRHVILP